MKIWALELQIQFNLFTLLKRQEQGPIEKQKKEQEEEEERQEHGKEQEEEQEEKTRNQDCWKFTH